MKQWSVSKPNKENAKEIAARLDLPPIIATLLDIRGISIDDAESFIYSDGVLDSPFDLIDMDKAASRVRRAIDNTERICVYGDYDADGVTSTALLCSYLLTCGADAFYYIPDRETEGYGMNKTAVDHLKAEGTELIITVDNGISAYEEIAYANELGIDTVVTDHHRPPETIPKAVAVVDPHRKDCPSRFKDICGVAVAFKLVEAVEGEYADVEMLLENYSDLLCIGTIGDIMPLVDENRVFVKHGLKSINNSDRPGIRALIDNAGLNGKEINSGKVSFTIVPRINAVGRLGRSNESVTLLTTEDFAEAGMIAGKLGDNNTERQRIEKDILQKINKLIAENPSLVYDSVIVIDGEGWHQGVIGIVSSRVKDIYGKPCIIITRDETCRGSGRSVEGFDIYEAVSSCSDLLSHFGGHPMAVGLSLDPENITKFRKRINEYASKADMPFDKLKIDCGLNPAALDVEIAKDLSYLKPYGAGNPTPLFRLKELRLSKITPISGGKHLRLSFAYSAGELVAMKFFSTPEEFPYKPGDVLDIAVNLDSDVFRNSESLSIIIKDIKYSDVNNLDYMDSLRCFEYFCKGRALAKDELLSIIPTRSEFADIYRYLKRCESLSNLSVEVMVHNLGGKLTYAKVKVALEAMNDLGLIALYEDMYKTCVKLLPVSEKVRIEDAAIIKKLKEVYRGE